VQKERIFALGRLAVSVTPTIFPESVRMPADVVARIQSELMLLEETEPGSRIGNRSTATKRRDDALKDLRRAVSRIRFFCAVPPDSDAFPAKARPRRLQRRSQTLPFFRGAERGAGG
jgi:hypothetical protein